MMKEAILYTPAQRAVALTTIAKFVFKPEYVDQILDEKHEELGNISLIQYARKGVAEYRQAERYLTAGLVYA